MSRSVADSSTDGLLVGHDFANAVLYALSDHPEAAHTPRGIILPIAEDVWQQVFHQAYPDVYDGQNMQNLAAYCSYFRLGKHGIGYDRKGNRDFAQGVRIIAKDRGKWGLDVSRDPKRAVWPSGASQISATETIRKTIGYLRTHHPNWNNLERRIKHLSPVTEGNYGYEFEEVLKDPVRREILIEAFERKVSWAKLARRLYGFDCMIPGCDFEIIKEGGERYIEVHHVEPMFEGGSPNDKRNLSVLCPNHHREAHYARIDRRHELTRMIRKEQRRRLSAK
jgi:hypothetical protein